MVNTMTIRISEDLLNRIRETGIKTDRSIASVLRFAAQEYCDKVEKEELIQ